MVVVQIKKTTVYIEIISVLALLTAPTKHFPYQHFTTAMLLCFCHININPMIARLFPSPQTPTLGVKSNPSQPFLYYWSQTNLACMCWSTDYLWIYTIIHYMWLICLQWQLCATMCMVNFVNKLQKSKEKIHILFHFYNIDHW